MSKTTLISKVSKNNNNLSSFFCKYYSSFFLTASILSFLFASCGKMPVGVSNEDTGALEIRTCIQSPSNLSKSMAKSTSSSDSLIIEISGPEISTLRFSKLFDLSRSVHTDTLIRIPTGSNRQIKVYTVDNFGNILLSDTNTHRSLRIDPNTTTPLTILLMPAVGSIYLQLENIPTTVDSVIATFTSSKQTWVARAKQSAKIFLSIDKIPDGTKGNLTVAAISPLKDTLYSAKKDSIIFNANKMETIALSFTTTPGHISFDMSVVLPGVTTASGSIDTTKASDTIPECGSLVITEIMCKDGLEYIEVYNPNFVNTTYDSLYIDINDKKPIAFSNITFYAQKAIVFIRDTFPWRDSTCYLAKALDLLSSTGNTITIRSKNNLLIDRVAFPIGTNTLEWPVFSGAQAIVLDTNYNDVNLNNFGRNWHVATSLIPGTTDQYGTPKTR